VTISITAGLQENAFEICSRLLIGSHAVACSPDIPKLSGSGSIRTSRPFWDREFEQSCQECEHVLILLLAHSSTNYVDVALKRHWHDVILLRQVARCSAITSLQGTQLCAHWLYLTSAICCVTPTVTTFNQCRPCFLSGFTALIGLIVKCCCMCQVWLRSTNEAAARANSLSSIRSLSFPIATFSS